VFSPTTTADSWVPWLFIALLLVPFVLFAILGRAQAVLWTLAAEFALFVLAGLFLSEWLFLATPVVIAAGFVVTAICYFAATQLRNSFWRHPPSRKDKT